MRRSFLLLHVSWHDLIFGRQPRALRRTRFARPDRSQIVRRFERHSIQLKDSITEKVGHPFKIGSDSAPVHFVLVERK